MHTQHKPPCRRRCAPPTSRRAARPPLTRPRYVPGCSGPEPDEAPARRPPHRPGARPASYLRPQDSTDVPILPLFQNNFSFFDTFARSAEPLGEQTTDPARPPREPRAPARLRRGSLNCCRLPRSAPTVTQLLPSLCAAPQPLHQRAGRGPPEQPAPRCASVARRGRTAPRRARAAHKPRVFVR
jgi:hypothetical protein